MGFLHAIGRIFTWWDGQTLNTQLWSWRKGHLVGEDADGNRFFETADGKRRWVLYNGEAEASRVSPDWHGWLHHTCEKPPTQDPPRRKPWQKPHQPNLTGTAAAYRPKGSLLGNRHRPQVTGDYDAWTPGG